MSISPDTASRESASARPAAGAGDAHTTSRNTPAESSARAVFGALESLADTVAHLQAQISQFPGLEDTALLEVTRLLADTRSALDAVTASCAGEVGRRSSPILGSDGLAARRGFRTPQALLQVVARMAGRDASSALRIGRAMIDESEQREQPWMLPPTEALRAGAISIAAADSIRVGLGVPNSAVSAGDLIAASILLCDEARRCDPDQLRVRALELRTNLDAHGVALNESARREQRSLRIYSSPDGMGKVVWTMDPETLVTVKDLYDRATSPKLGGVRFVSEPSRGSAERIVADGRSAEQLASDAFVQLLKEGANSDSSSLLSSGAPVVRITTTARSRSSRSGHAYFDGNPAAISIETVERLACNGAEKQLRFDATGRLLDASRESRLYSARQRDALAVRDGGCMFPNCGRPPSWCEAHHVKFWGRDGGKTIVENGILLCRHHHLLVHNNGWQIEHDATGQRVLIPPSSIDSRRKPIPMPSKSLALRQLLAERVS